MNVEIETSEYEVKDYGKPWGAKINFAKSPREMFDFTDCEWIGDARVGSKGINRIKNVKDEDIVAIGQKAKPYSYGKTKTTKFYRVQIDGTLDYLGDKGDALLYYKKGIKKTVPVKEDTELNNLSKEDLINQLKAAMENQKKLEAEIKELKESVENQKKKNIYDANIAKKAKEGTMTYNETRIHDALTIEAETRKKKADEKAKTKLAKPEKKQTGTSTKKRSRSNTAEKPCRICHTYCYGDCTANYNY